MSEGIVILASQDQQPPQTIQQICNFLVHANNSDLQLNTASEIKWVEMICKDDANVAIFRTCYETFRKVKSENQTYLKLFAQQRRQMIYTFIETWKKSNNVEDFYESEFRTFILK